MKRVALFSGSFNPFHEGHASIVRQAAPLFDKIFIVLGVNTAKNPSENGGTLAVCSQLRNYGLDHLDIEVAKSDKLMVDFILSNNLSLKDEPIVAVIKGLRNTTDFEYEKIQQYWNEDLGIIVPTLYFIAGRELTHISSSAIRMVQKLEKREI